MARPCAKQASATAHQHQRPRSPHFGTGSKLETPKTSVTFLQSCPRRRRANPIPLSLDESSSPPSAIGLLVQLYSIVYCVHWPRDCSALRFVLTRDLGSFPGIDRAQQHHHGRGRQQLCAAQWQDLWTQYEADQSSAKLFQTCI